MILVLGGTSTTHQIVAELGNQPLIISVATDYGQREFSARYPGRVLHTRFSAESLAHFITGQDITRIIDTTHPHAREISAIARTVAAQQSIPYEDRIRPVAELAAQPGIITCQSAAEAATYLLGSPHQRILFTTGSNTIPHFAPLATRGYARVLPFEDSIAKCVAAGFERSRIIALQGPFSTDFNLALCREYRIDCLVTKNSGAGSGFDEKREACLELGIEMVVVG
ncbi:precorrin-6A reductase [Desulfurispirillum indicum]|uniref:precorrin-6A reductase n=1 Tax=Desulfurispirillum indicum TaxID=936456 RepID=UPI001CFB7C26|nr:precorrin-6A reductase [Desulfurispirillum indicum]UCZ55758.1 precorrin-6A reductase [Desulfurispirillum indicum]